MNPMTLTPDQRDYARVSAIISGLKLDIAGIKPTHGFAGVRLAREYGYTGRTKQGALEYLEKYRNAILNVNTTIDYEDLTTRFAEHVGITVFKVDGNLMSWLESYPTEGNYHVVLDLNTGIETRTQE